MADPGKARAMTDSTWPPSDTDLNWRPPASTPPNSSISSSEIPGGEGSPPNWIAIPDGVVPDEDGDVDIPAYLLADVFVDADRPGGGGGSDVYAIRTTDGDFRIVIT